MVQSCQPQTKSIQSSTFTLRCFGSRRYDLNVNSQTSIHRYSHTVNKTEWISTERAANPVTESEAHTSRSSEMPIPFRWPSPTLATSIMESDSSSAASTDTGPLESPSVRLSTFSRRSSRAVQSAVLGRPVTLIHIVHLSVCSVSWISRLFTSSSCQTSRQFDIFSI